jgi:hypothetical protein
MTEKQIQITNNEIQFQSNYFEPKELKFKDSLIIALPDVFGVNSEKTNSFIKKLSEAVGVTAVLIDPFRGNPWNNGTPIGADYSKFPGFQKKNFNTKLGLTLILLIKKFFLISWLYMVTLSLHLKNLQLLDVVFHF